MGIILLEKGCLFWALLQEMHQFWSIIDHGINFFKTKIWKLDKIIARSPHNDRKKRQFLFDFVDVIFLYIVTIWIYLIYLVVYHVYQASLTLCWARFVDDQYQNKWMHFKDQKPSLVWYSNIPVCLIFISLLLLPVHVRFKTWFKRCFWS